MVSCWDPNVKERTLRAITVVDCSHQEPFDHAGLAGERVRNDPDRQLRPAFLSALEVVQDAFPDDLDQSSNFEPAEPEPIPEDDFDQSRGG